MSRMNKTQAKQLTLAIDLANRMHAGQTDRGGMPYIIHCLWVMQQQKTLNRMVAAVLHDTIEDTSLTLNDLRMRGFIEHQIAVVDLLTRRKTETRTEALERLLTAKDTLAGQDAIQIRMDDARHNSQLSRIKKPKEQDIVRCLEYSKLYQRLKSEKIFDGFLDEQNNSLFNFT